MVIEVVAAWVVPGTRRGLVVPVAGLRATLVSLSWNESPGPSIAIGVGVAGVLRIIVGLTVCRGDVCCEAPTSDMTIATLAVGAGTLVGTGYGHHHP